MTNGSNSSGVVLYERIIMATLLALKNFNVRFFPKLLRLTTFKKKRFYNLCKFFFSNIFHYNTCIFVDSVISLRPKEADDQRHTLYVTTQMNEC